MENKVKQLGKMDADQKLVLVAGLVSILSIAFIFMGTRIWEEYKKGRHWKPEIPDAADR